MSDFELDNRTKKVILSILDPKSKIAYFPVFHLQLSVRRPDGASVVVDEFDSLTGSQYFKGGKRSIFDDSAYRVNMSLINDMSYQKARARRRLAMAEEEGDGDGGGQIGRMEDEDEVPEELTREEKLELLRSGRGEEGGREC
eukprot:748828-Hanusia_phi.AAC.2